MTGHATLATYLASRAGFLAGARRARPSSRVVAGVTGLLAEWVR